METGNPCVSLASTLNSRESLDITCVIGEFIQAFSV
jgi:hypothetical protein